MRNTQKRKIRVKRKKPVASVKAVKTQIKSLQKRMPQPNRLYYGYRRSQLLNVVPTPYVSYNLMRWGTWSRIFGTGAEDESVRTAKFRSASLQHYVTHFGTGGELDAVQTVTYTYFLVKLTKKGSYLLDENTGELKTLINNTHYYSTDYVGVGGLGGMTLLNKQFFKILKYKKFTLGNQFQGFSGGPQTQYGTDRRWDDKVYINQDVTNPSGNWRDTTSPQSPQQNIFSILFFDNVIIEREPRWSFNMVISADTY